MCILPRSVLVGIVLPQLLQWISLHFPQADEKVKSILEECPEQPETHADYWNALTIFLMQVKWPTIRYQHERLS